MCFLAWLCPQDTLKWNARLLQKTTNVAIADGKPVYLYAYRTDLIGITASAPMIANRLAAGKSHT